jgi:hypothetical protein
MAWVDAFEGMLDTIEGEEEPDPSLLLSTAGKPSNRT